MKYLWQCILYNVTSLWAIYLTKQPLRCCVYFSFKVFLSEFVMKFPLRYSPRHPVWEFPIIILSAGDFYNREMSLEIFFIILEEEFLFSILILQSYIVLRILKLSSDGFWKSYIICEILKVGITSKYFIVAFLGSGFSVLPNDWLLKYIDHVSFVLVLIPYDPKRHKFLFKSIFCRKSETNISPS